MIGEQAKMHLVILPLAEISPNPIREVSGQHINDLRESIKKYGVLQPILVQISATLHGYEIICGNHRYYAAKGAGLTRIPAIIKNGLSSRDKILLSITENIQRLALDPWEAGKIFREALAGIPIDVLAEDIGKSKVYIRKRVQIYEQLNPRLVDKLRSGELTLANAYRLSRLPKKTQLKISEEIRRYRHATEQKYKTMRNKFRGFGGGGFGQADLCICPKCGAIHPRGVKKES